MSCCGQRLAYAVTKGCLAECHVVLPNILYSAARWHCLTLKVGFLRLQNSTSKAVKLSQDRLTPCEPAVSTSGTRTQKHGCNTDDRSSRSGIKTSRTGET